MLRWPENREAFIRRLLVACLGVCCHGVVGNLLTERPSGKEHYCPLSTCTDPMGSGKCYEPVCPIGYYRCCATCQDAVCYGTMHMELSWRGIPECILCPPGYTCSGCDIYEKCPVSDRPGREGARVSKRGSKLVSDCETCASSMEASPDNSQCVPRYTIIDGEQVCSKLFVQRCIRSCEAPDAKRRKQLTDCEMMKCTMYCAKLWSPECAAKMSMFCLQSTQDQMVDQSLAVMEAATLFIEDCDVDCSSARRRHVIAVVAVVVGLAAFLFSADMQ